MWIDTWKMPLLLTDGKTRLEKLDYGAIRSDHILQVKRNTLKILLCWINFWFQLNASEFIKNAVPIQDSLRCLYVGQREVATVTSGDPFIDIIGSDDATTCHIVLLVDESKKNIKLILYNKAYIRMLCN